MPIEQRVDAVVVDWCGQAGPYPSGQNLQELWVSTLSKHDYDFQPTGVQRLIVKLVDEFRTGDPKLKIELVPTDFEPSGAVKTMQDLRKAVGASFLLNLAGGS
jgi:hypothetical protein